MTALRDRFFARLLVAILISMTASEVAVDVVIYYRLRGTLEADLGERLVRTANAISLGLDARLVSQFRTGDEDLSAYKLVRARLSQQVEANGLGRAYVVDRELRTLIDSSEAASVGEARYSLMAHRRQTTQAWDGVATPTPLYVNEEGQLRLTALAPLRAPDGAVSALLGVDAAPEFFAALGDLRREMAILGLVSLGVAGLGGFLLIRSAARRLERVRETVARASLGDFTAPNDPRSTDQIGALERGLDGLLESIVARVDYYESLMASVDIGLIAADLDGNVMGANATVARWLGGGRLVGRPLLEALSVDADLAAFGAEALARSEAGLTREIAVRSGAAAGHTLAVVVSPLTQSGRRTGTTLSLSDVTALRTLERHARAHERLAALGTMAAGLLHEIRSPLASMMMHLDLLRPSVADREGLEVLDQALGSAERLSRFLVDFQIVAGLRPLRRDWVDFHDAIESVLDAVEIPPTIQLRLTRDGPAVVHADRDLLEHATRNLLVNAVEALGPSGGAVAVDVRRSGEDIVLTVSDSGPGVAVGHLDRVFDPMFTTKPTGTGLGLTIVTRVVEAHGGSIHVANAQAGGAVFTVRWPRGDQG